MEKVLTPESSQINFVAYDKASLSLLVEFKKGSQYKYSHVPEDVWLGLKSAESKGKFLNAYIKNEYVYEKL